uniref:Col_cuticle_N domain-containing protein n=1 Tax=Caenorhabditis tropicalis TaxID=1561998 RepID=A0A1I7U9K4_9PELO
MDLNDFISLCSIFVSISIILILFVAILYLCAYYMEKIELLQYALCMQYFASRDLESVEPDGSTISIPQITITSSDDDPPPMYEELDTTYAYPCPPYEEP